MTVKRVHYLHRIYEFTIDTFTIPAAIKETISVYIIGVAENAFEIETEMDTNT